MRTRLIVIASIGLAAVALAWSLRLGEPTIDRTVTTIGDETIDARDPARPPPSRAPTPSTSSGGDSIDTATRANFNKQAREFFAQAPSLAPEEARQRAEVLSQELSRIEQAGGLSAGETFLLRAGLIRATVPDERQQMAQIRALKERYEISSRQRLAQGTTQSDPMFQLYKVREGQIVAEVMSLQTIPDGLSREEYLRRRLQTEREQLLGESM